MNFASPLILAALALLPLLYLLIRLFPPAPKIIAFPAYRLLSDLSGEKQTMKKAPLWLRLLRLGILTSLIIGLAGPVQNPQSHSLYTKNLHLVIQNDWASGQYWPAIQAQAESLLKIADQQGRGIILSKTNRAASETPYLIPQVLTAYEAMQRLKSITPQPWPIDPLYLEQRINAIDQADNAAKQTLWVGTGLAFDNHAEVFAHLMTQGGLDIFAPAKSNLAIIKADPSAPRKFEIAGTETSFPPVTLKDVQGRSRARFENGDQAYDNGQLTLDRAYSEETAQISLDGQTHAGATFLRKSGELENKVYLANPFGAEDTGISLSNPLFYLNNALRAQENLSIESGALTAFLDDIKAQQHTKSDLVILPDTSLSRSEQEQLSEWIEQGHIVLRFAGTRLSESTTDELSPVPLRAGFRSLDGNLQFGAAPRQLSFKDGTALSGLQMSDELKLNKQILAQPGFDLSEYLWASLEDGTPIITARQIGDGLLILVHVTADPSWSDLPLSGVFPQILGRITQIIETVNSGNTAHVFEDYKTNALLRPTALLDGFGRLRSLSPQERDRFQPVAATQEHLPSRETPPGLYRLSLAGSTASQNLIPHNFADLPPKELSRLIQPASYPNKARILTHNDNESKPLAAFFFLLAALLFLIDCLITIGSTKLNRPGIAKAAVFILGFIISLTLGGNTAHAQNRQGPEIWTQGLYLAYIKSGDTKLDRKVEQGLKTLASVMATRTSAEANGVVGLSTEELSQMKFFPLIYWPIDDNTSAFRQSPPNTQQQNAIANYLNHGGTILFDLTSPLYAFNGASPSLRNITDGLAISTLIEPPEDTVLGKSFYLLDRLQGNKPGRIWIEQSPQQGRDDVSAVIISTLDLAGAWGLSATTSQRRKQEMSWRSGINIMMYILTGHYKADQVHLPHILRRLGQ